MSATIGAVKARLVTVLAAALPSTQVEYGPISKTTLPPRVLEVGGESTPLTVAVSDLAGSSGTETYILTLTASVSLSGVDLALAETQAVADFRAAVAAIQADGTLGLDNVSATVSGSGELNGISGAWGRAVAVRFPVEIFTAN